MSVYRPYAEPNTFRYPTGSPVSSTETSDFDKYVHIDLEEIVAGKSRLSVVGLSVSRFYARMLVSQPFEVSRFLLQVGEWDNRKLPAYEDYDFEEDHASSSSDEEVDYFVDVRDTADPEAGTLRLGSAKTRKAQRRKYKPSKSREVQLFSKSLNRDPFESAIDLPNGPFIFSLMGGLSEHEGVFGLWRALNASCLCRAATGVLTAWSTSFLAQLGNVQDPQFVNLLQFAGDTRAKLLAVSTAGCALTAALLTPLYMIQARLVATSITSRDQPRSLRASILGTIASGQVVAPWWVILPTTLAATLHHFCLNLTPMLIGQYLMLDPFTAPKAFQISELLTSLLGVLVKMPFETMASRAQLKASRANPRSLVVRPVEYNGVLATVWEILRGDSPIASLYRGWRSEVVGLLGEWGYNALDALDEGKVQQEYF